VRQTEIARTRDKLTHGHMSSSDSASDRNVGSKWRIIIYKFEFPFVKFATFEQSETEDEGWV
jgi:hypothetical protein